MTCIALYHTDKAVTPSYEEWLVLEEHARIFLVTRRNVLGVLAAYSATTAAQYTPPLTPWRKWGPTTGARARCRSPALARTRMLLCHKRSFGVCKRRGPALIFIPIVCVTGWVRMVDRGTY